MPNLLRRLLKNFQKSTDSIIESSIDDAQSLTGIKDSTVDFHENIAGNDNTQNNVRDSYNTYNTTILQQQLTEPQLTSANSDVLTDKVKPIEDLIASGMTVKAIEAYKQLLFDNIDSGLSNNDKFTIYNGLLNCYVNMNEDDEKIQSLIIKIELLGEVKELHRFLYIQSVYYFNKHDFPKAIYYNNKSLDYKSDYLNAILTKIFLNSVNNSITYKDAVESIISHQKYTSGTIREITSMKTTLGDISFQCGEYAEAIKYYEEANEFNYTVIRELAIGVSYYSLASIHKEETSNTVKLNEIDYAALNKAVEIFSNLYNTKDAELRKSLYKRLMPFYFSCLHLAQKPSEILKISSESREYIDVKNNDLMRLKAMAELSLGKYNEETIKDFTPEEKFKFEIFNLSERGKHEELIAKLKPFIDDSKYHYSVN